MANGYLLYIVAILFLMGTMLRYGFFLLRNNRRAARGEPLRFSSGRTVRYAERFILALLICGVGMFISVILQSPTGSTALTVGLMIIAGAITCGICKWYRWREIRTSGGCAADSGADGNGDEIYGDVYSKTGDALRAATKNRIALLIVTVIVVVSGIALVGTVEVHRNNDKDSEGRLEYYDPVTEEHVVEYVSSDVIPLSFDDLGVKNGGILSDQGEYVGSHTYAEKTRSLLGTVLDCYESGYSNTEGASSYIGYNIARCRFDWVRDRVLDEYKSEGYYANHGEFHDITEKEGKLWDADRVYAAADDGSDVRLVIRDKTILFIENDRVDYTEEVIADILEGLEAEL